MRIAVLYNQVPDDNRESIAENEILDSVKAVSASLEELGHEAVEMKVSWEAFNALQRVDAVFNLAEGFGSNLEAEPHIAGVLDMLDLPYTGSSPGTLEICRNKYLAKLLLDSLGIPQPRYQLLESRDGNFQLDFPVIVKPVQQDASIGIYFDSVVHDHDSLREKVGWVISTYGQPAIVEEYIDGREINVSVLVSGKPEVLPLSEIIFDLPPGVPRIMGFESKWIEDHPYFQATVPSCPASVESHLEDKIREIALGCFQIVGARDYVRVDMRIRGEKIFVIEVNPNPSINPTGSGFIRSAGADGLDYTQVVSRILDSALGRKKVRERKKDKQFSYDGIILDACRPKHAESLVKWFNDRENTRFMETTEKYTKEDLITGFLNSDDQNFIVNYNGKSIGFASIYDSNKDSATISFLIGEPEFQGKGIGNKIITALEEFAFNQLKVKSLFASATISNLPSIRALKSAGFKEVGTRRAYQKVGDEFIDDMLFDILQEEYMDSKIRENTGK